ncbi:non-ribosomal peptide synthetase [Luedemannella helvata]|uniref:Carrier domain-containing protein n=1 Tax=Luedemannella helvata TaxID=349315 RepID=A0ABP4X1F6_9ACTN
MTTTHLSPVRTGVRYAIDLVRERVLADRDAPAVDDGVTRLTYGQLWDAAGRLARRLAPAGDDRVEVPVGVVLPRSAALVVAVVAAHRAGRAYLPLDPSLPPERQRRILATAEVRTVLTEADVDLVPGADPVDDAGPDVLPDDLAYVVFTSGSTGEPKGVLIDQRNLAYLVEVDHALFGRSPADRVALVASPGFDASVWEIWPTLAAGGSLVVVAQDVVLDPARLRAFLLDRDVTVAFVPTVLAERLLALPWPATGCRLRLLLTGGDRLVRRPAPGLPFVLVNNYGPSEASVFVASGPVAPDGDGPPSIGRPVPGTRIHLLTDDLVPVPRGDVGELYLSGPGVGQGYLGRPDLAAERFLPDPFGAEPGAVMYRTGDLGRWGDDGIEFAGRVDDQVQVRGQRVEPGEIAAELLRQPGISAAHVMVCPTDRADDAHLVAYVVGDATDPAQVRRGLAQVVPAGWLPRHVVAVERIPMTANGKVDVPLLPQAHDTVTAAPAFIGAADGTEQAVAECWRQVLGLPHIDPDVGFFEAGGHSLHLAEVQALLAARLGVELPLTTLFEHPTIRSLAARVRTATAGAGDAALDEPSARRRGSREGRAARLRQVRAEQVTSWGGSTDDR